MKYLTHKEAINAVGIFIIDADGEGGLRPIYMNLHCGLLKIWLKMAIILWRADEM